jgi:hypothetical protein
MGKITKFFAESALVQAFVDNRSGPERLAASPWAKATTPDQLIVAHILHDYAKNPDNWKTFGSFPNALANPHTRSHYRPDGYSDKDATRWYRTDTFVFTLTDGKATAKLFTYIKNKDGDGCSPWYEKYFFEVNNVRLDDKANLELFSKIKSLMTQKKEAEIAAARALVQLEENERKWNLAETLLGMKRNEFGALVPKEETL